LFSGINEITVNFVFREKYNQELSEKRAQSVVNYFVSSGIPGIRFLPGDLARE